MGTRSLEEPFLLGLHLSQIAWGRTAGVPSNQLRRPEGTAKMFMGILGCSQLAARKLEQLVETADGTPRTLKGSEILREVAAFRREVTECLVRDLSRNGAAALGLGFNTALALGFSQLAMDSPDQAKQPLLEILKELAADAKTLALFRWRVDSLLSFTAKALTREDFNGIHSQVMGLSAHAQAELRGLGDEPKEPQN